MATLSIGQFIAVLRKANGMTQQEVADRLNVSNKAVSRWERDECAPDLSVIPALAEMFNVTCDELLKGERIMPSSHPQGKEPKVEKQVRNLISKSLSGFKTFLWVSLSAAVMGLVCMFGISYGFYRPLIGFSVMLLFEVCSLVLAILAVSRAKETRTDNELFELADGSLVARFDGALGNLSFGAFFTVLSAVALSLPLLFTSDPAYLVVSAYEYFTCFFPAVVTVLTLIWLLARKPFGAWITGQPLARSVLPEGVHKKTTTMTLLQMGLLLLAGTLFLVAPFFERHQDSFLPILLQYLGLACLPASIACFVVYLIKADGNRTHLFLPGLRNLLMTPPLLLLTEAHSVSWSSVPEAFEQLPFTREDTWYVEYIWYTAALCLAVFLVFTLIDRLVSKGRKAP